MLSHLSLLNRYVSRRCKLHSVVSNSTSTWQKYSVNKSGSSKTENRLDLAKSRDKVKWLDLDSLVFPQSNALTQRQRINKELITSSNSCRYFCSLPQGSRQFSTWNKMIVYSRITPSDSPAVAKHLLSSFFKEEPFGLALGLTVDQVEPWYPKFLNEVLNYYEPVSFMAKDTDTNEVVGVIINIIMDLEDTSRKPPPGMKPYLDRAKQPVKWQIATFLEDLEEGVDVVKSLKMDPSKPNKMLVCLFLSVSPDYGGKGLAKTLIRESEQEAKQIEGVTITMTDVTSHYSYMAFKKLGYEQIKEVQYLAYKDPDGVPIFEGREEKLGVHTHARVMAKPI